MPRKGWKATEKRIMEDYDVKMSKLFRSFFDKKITFRQLWNRYWDLRNKTQRTLEYEWVFGGVTSENPNPQKLRH